METFRYENLDIKYVRSGVGSPLIFLHNGGTSHIIWKEVMNRLSDSYETFAIDLLGYGASSKPETGYELGKHVAILTAFIKHLRLEKVVLIGNCMGCAILLKYTMDNSANVRALVLVNPLTTNTFTAGKLGFFLRLRQFAPQFSKAIYRRLGKFRLNRFVSEQSLRMQFGSTGKSKHLEKTEDLCVCFTAEGQMNSLLWTLDDLVNYSVFDSFSPTENFPPVCTVWGLENEILSAKSGRVLNTTLKPEREEWIAGGGHLVMLEEPEKTAEIIHDFIGSK